MHRTWCQFVLQSPNRMYPLLFSAKLLSLLFFRLFPKKGTLLSLCHHQLCCGHYHQVKKLFQMRFSIPIHLSPFLPVASSVSCQFVYSLFFSPFFIINSKTMYLLFFVVFCFLVGCYSNLIC